MTDPIFVPHAFLSSCLTADGVGVALDPAAACLVGVGVLRPLPAPLLSILFSLEAPREPGPAPGLEICLTAARALVLVKEIHNLD